MGKSKIYLSFPLRQASVMKNKIKTIGGQKMAEQKPRRKPYYSNNFIAIWQNSDKNGKTYLSIRVFGSYFNVFQTRQE